MTPGVVRTSAVLVLLLLLASTHAEASSLVEFDFSNFVNGQRIGGASSTASGISSATWDMFNNGAETFGPGGIHSMTRFLGEFNGQEVGPSMTFTTTEEIRIDEISFAHEHNHNPGFPTFGGYGMKLEIDSGPGYQEIDRFRAEADGISFKSETITITGGLILPAGTHKVRWYPVLPLTGLGSPWPNTNTEYFGIDDFMMDGQVLWSTPAPPAPPETEIDYIQSGGSGWDSVYDVEFKNGALVIDVNIFLVGADPGIALRNQWEAGIEGIWSNAYEITDGVFTYPIQVNVNWVTSDWDYIVRVFAGEGRPTMTQWYTMNPAGWGEEYHDEIAAHEVGHMLGLYDEYLPDGVLDPNTLLVTTNSIMADLGPPREWHFEKILAWLAGEIPRDLSLLNAPAPYPQDAPLPQFSDRLPFPEPATGVLLGVGVGLTLLFRIRRRRAA